MTIITTPPNAVVPTMGAYDVLIRQRDEAIAALDAMTDQRDFLRRELSQAKTQIASLEDATP